MMSLHRIGAEWGKRLLSGLVALFSLAAMGTAAAETLRVMTTGLGDGSVSGGAINCMPDGTPSCDAVTAMGVNIVLTATPGPGAVFGGWGGDCPDADPTTPANQCRVAMTAYRSVRARFDMATPIV
jgi:hypothetical protein